MNSSYFYKFKNFLQLGRIFQILFLYSFLWYVFCCLTVSDEGPRPKKRHFISSLDFNHCNLLPYSIGQGQGSGPSVKQYFHYWIYSIKPLSHFPSEEMVSESKILLFITPHRHRSHFLWNVSFRKNGNGFLSGFFPDHHLCIDES